MSKEGYWRWDMFYIKLAACLFSVLSGSPSDTPPVPHGLAVERDKLSSLCLPVTVAFMVQNGHAVSTLGVFAVVIAAGHDSFNHFTARIFSLPHKLVKPFKLSQ